MRLRKVWICNSSRTESDRILLISAFTHSIADPWVCVARKTSEIMIFSIRRSKSASKMFQRFLIRTHQTIFGQSCIWRSKDFLKDLSAFKVAIRTAHWYPTLADPILYIWLRCFPSKLPISVQNVQFYTAIAPRQWFNGRIPCRIWYICIVMFV